MEESRVRGLLRLIKHNRITLEDIKDEEYRAEVESRLEE